MSVDLLEKVAFYEQSRYVQMVSEIMSLRKTGEIPLAFIRTYGCQQNVSDGEKIKGMRSDFI